MNGQSTIRILIADDHALVRAGLRRLIESERGLEVAGEAATGEEAVECAFELRPDVLLMDISMPGLSGTAATDRIARDLPDVRVLVLTMHDDRGHLRRMLDAGAAGYVLKRSSPDQLVRAIRTVAEGGSYVDPQLAGEVLRAGNPAPDVDAARLSSREEEVLRRVAWGESNKSIARDLGVSVRTVETYKARIADKLGLRTRPDIVRYALRRGWLDASDAEAS